MILFLRKSDKQLDYSKRPIETITITGLIQNSVFIFDTLPLTNAFQDFALLSNQLIPTDYSPNELPSELPI